MTDKPSDVEQQQGQSARELWSHLRFVSSLGLGVCAIVVVFSLAGWLATKYLSTGNVGFVLSILTGGVVSVLWAWKRVAWMMHRMYRDKAGERQRDEGNISPHNR